MCTDGPKDEDEEDELSVDEGVEFDALFNARVQSHQLLKTIATGGVTVMEIGVSRDVTRGCCQHRIMLCSCK